MEETEYTVIQMSERRSVRILVANWPIIAEASEDNGSKDQGMEPTVRRTVKVRMHRHDGRLIVYGTQTSEHDLDPSLVAGYLLPRDGNVTGALSDVCMQLDCNESMLHRVLDELPPEDLDAAPSGGEHRRADRGDARVLHDERP